MENNKSEFKATGVYFDGAREYEIQISDSGDAARYRRILRLVSGTKVNLGRWQEIRYNNKGDAYITVYGRRIYLYNFLRINLFH